MTTVPHVTPFDLERAVASPAIDWQAEHAYEAAANARQDRLDAEKAACRVGPPPAPAKAAPDPTPRGTATAEAWQKFVNGLVRRAFRKNLDPVLGALAEVMVAEERRRARDDDALRAEIAELRERLEKLEAAAPAASPLRMIM